MWLDDKLSELWWNLKKRYIIYSRLDKREILKALDDFEAKSLASVFYIARWNKSPTDEELKTWLIARATNLSAAVYRKEEVEILKNQKSFTDTDVISYTKQIKKWLIEYLEENDSL